MNLSALTRAAEFLEREAQGLKESHSLRGEWYLVDEVDHGAKRYHDEMLELARELRELVQSLVETMR